MTPLYNHLTLSSRMRYLFSVASVLAISLFACADIFVASSITFSKNAINLLALSVISLGLWYLLKPTIDLSHRKPRHLVRRLRSRIMQLLTWPIFFSHATEKPFLLQTLGEHLHADELAHFNRLQMLAEMLTSLIHEISQPLSAISTFSMVATMQLESKTPNHKALAVTLEQTIEQANHATAMIEQLRLMASSKPLPSTAICLNQPIEKAFSLIKHELIQQQISCVLELAKDLPPIKGNEVQLCQVVLNLIRNSVQAISLSKEEKKQIKIKTYLEKNTIVLTIQDTGLGIDQQTRQNLFKPFISTKPQGMGIGLSIVKSIVQAHRGKISLANSDGIGTCFRITLPTFGKPYNVNNTEIKRGTAAYTIADDCDCG